ncbi:MULTISPECIES: molybdate ABC transporter substrate-binding protein [unclassified Microbacterium]|uniref:molybdate ABC transporter substrate-binding protein n=1 Tax=unclassified Microbacterium TaxID=2609290 RepID=UPI00214B3DF0|nr:MULTISPECIES: molybdate ABC transporter substrate-binding protein [unclassified Microbacterium]MCR2808713.1 molybdate ABC transporter substrate-binding protein [Microbacterium sp. zg.B185]WIM18856.1 molybdate ABC transporter substrate-binding protein [Microbacterium sp. zg-B185]
MRARRTGCTGILIAAALAAGLAGCAAGTADRSAAPESDTGIEGSITVFAAASLNATFTELAATFERDHPGTTVRVSFAGSSDLATQILEGAPADVFASADESTMAKIADADLVAGEPVAFATNVVQIAVPAPNPAGIATFADLAAPGVKLVVCAPEVPCGAAAARVAAIAGVPLTPVSEESSVTDVLGKVASGEADAGLVYATDVRAAGAAVEGIEIDRAQQAANIYPIAALTDAGTPAVAKAFVDFILSESGRSALAAAGFGLP